MKVEEAVYLNLFINCSIVQYTDLRVIYINGILLQAISYENTLKDYRKHIELIFFKSLGMDLVTRTFNYPENKTVIPTYLLLMTSFFLFICPQVL